MSWEATQWANRQRMKDAQTQIVLLVLANCADPEGLAFGWRKGQKHWDQYLVDHCRLSRATIFRKVADMKELGLVDPQIILHDTGQKQYVVQLDLQRFAHWIEEGDAGRYVIGAAERVPGEPGEEAVSAAIDQEIMACENESQAETEKLARGVFRHPVESQAETHGIVPGQVESQAETDRVSLVRLQETPLSESNKKDSPPTPSRVPAAAKPPPIGFGAFKAEYPQSEAIPMRVWERAADEYAKLSEVDRVKAADAVSRYRVVLHNFNRKPINPDKWMREREFERYSAASAASLGNARVFAAEGTEKWEAWSNVLCIRYGDFSRIPKTYQGRGPHGERGIVMPMDWPLGGEAWRVPLDQWVFVEQYTPNFNRFNERVAEILGRGLTLIRASASFVKPHHRRIGRGAGGALSASDCFGSLVPGEWPPPKGSPAKMTVSDELKAASA